MIGRRDISAAGGKRKSGFVLSERSISFVQLSNEFESGKEANEAAYVRGADEDDEQMLNDVEGGKRERGPCAIKYTKPF